MIPNNKKELKTSLKIKKQSQKMLIIPKQFYRNQNISNDPKRFQRIKNVLNDWKKFKMVPNDPKGSKHPKDPTKSQKILINP